MYTQVKVWVYTVTNNELRTQFLLIFQATVGSEGLPVAVQCVGLPYDEELVLQLMKEIEREMKFEKL